MQVVYTADIFSRQHVGGISRYFVELIRELKRSDSIDIDLPLKWHINDHLRELQETTSLAGRYSPWLGLLRHVLPLLNTLIARPLTDSQIIHHTYYSLSTPSTAASLVVTAHDVMPELFWNRNHPRTKGLLLAKRRTFEAADRIIAVSEHTKNDIVDHYDLDPDVIDVIPHGNPMAGVFDSDKTELPTVAADGSEQPYLLYVGARGGYKNWEALVTAFAGSDVLRREFRVVCFGGGSFARSELELLDRLGISASVTVTAGDDRALATAYRNATAFVYPSRYEGFGLPPLEAMGCGCPVICSDAASIPEVVGGAGVYFDPADEDSIRSAIESTVDDAAKLKRLRQAGLDREKQFRWRTTAELTFQCYQRAMQTDADFGLKTNRAAA